MTDELTSKLTPRTFVDSMIRVGVIAVLGFACLQVFSPFLTIMLWALLLAIMFYPLHQGIAKRCGGRQGLASTLMVLVACLLVLPPLVLLGAALVDEAQELQGSFESGKLAIPQPHAEVAQWPVVGEKLYKVWNEAAADLPAFLKEHAGQLQKIGASLVDAASGTLSSVFLFLGAFLVAGIMMAFGQRGSAVMKRIYCRLAGPAEGAELQSLTVATVRSVAVGVLGVAFIQALLFGIGFALAGVPMAGLLALIVLFVGIIQLPALVVALPVIILMWVSGDGSTGANIGFTVYFLVAGMSDNVLKPLLLGRGVAAPMPVILIGALGGMITGGFMGLFVGAILLAVGYQIFMKWVDRGCEDA